MISRKATPPDADPAMEDETPPSESPGAVGPGGALASAVRAAVLFLGSKLMAEASVRRAGGATTWSRRTFSPKS